jgi:hypothetical protein
MRVITFNFPLNCECIYVTLNIVHFFVHWLFYFKARHVILPRPIQ